MMTDKEKLDRYEYAKNFLEVSYLCRLEDINEMEQEGDKGLLYAHYKGMNVAYKEIYHSLTGVYLEDIINADKNKIK